MSKGHNGQEKRKKEKENKRKLDLNIYPHFLYKFNLVESTNMRETKLSG